MVAGPEKPACVRAAACRPAHTAQPVCKRVVQEPTTRNSIEPAAWLPAMPSAAAIAAASSPSTAPAAAAAPKRHEPAAEDDARLLARAAERDAKVVAQQTERTRDDVGRQRSVADCHYLAAELLGERHDGVSRSALTWRRQAAKRSSRS